MPINISTLNLCLGLKNKKLLVKKLLEENEIDVQWANAKVITDRVRLKPQITIMLQL